MPGTRSTRSMASAAAKKVKTSEAAGAEAPPEKKAKKEEKDPAQLRMEAFKKGRDKRLKQAFETVDQMDIPTSEWRNVKSVLSPTRKEHLDGALAAVWVIYENAERMRVNVPDFGEPKGDEQYFQLLSKQGHFSIDDLIEKYNSNRDEHCVKFENDLDKILRQGLAMVEIEKLMSGGKTVEIRRHDGVETHKALMNYMDREGLFSLGEKYGDRETLAMLISAVGEGYCFPDHFYNGPACDWGGAVLRLAIELVAAHPKYKAKIKEGKFHCEGMAMGGTGFKSRHNTNVLYCGVIPDPEKGGDGRDLNQLGKEFELYDKNFFEFISDKIREQRPVPTTKIRHDFMLMHEELVLLVCEALSRSFSEEMVRVLLCLCRMLVYLEVAYGFIVDGHLLYVIKAWREKGDIRYEVACHKYHETSNKGEKEIGHLKHNYRKGVLQIIRATAAIIMEQQDDMDRILAKYESRPVKPEGQRRPMKEDSMVVFPLDCAFYSGNSDKVLEDTPVKFLKKVYYPGKKAVLELKRKDLTPDELKAEFDQQVEDDNFLSLLDDNDDNKWTSKKASAVKAKGKKGSTSRAKKADSAKGDEETLLQGVKSSMSLNESFESVK